MAVLHRLIEIGDMVDVAGRISPEHSRAGNAPVGGDDPLALHRAPAGIVVAGAGIDAHAGENLVDSFCHAIAVPHPGALLAPLERLSALRSGILGVVPSVFLPGVLHIGLRQIQITGPRVLPVGRHDIAVATIQSRFQLPDKQLCRHSLCHWFLRSRCHTALLSFHSTTKPAFSEAGTSMIL